MRHRLLRLGTEFYMSYLTQFLKRAFKKVRQKLEIKPHNRIRQNYKEFLQISKKNTNHKNS